MEDRAVENIERASNRVNVVRCRDCKYYRGHGLCAEDCGPAFYIDDDWFCASGERRIEDGNETDVGK